ncbi:MAG TPA: OmpA family protein [Pseudomonas sabulinigri]|jgi:OOP family OmpA-OmpF porin|uniref:OmpA-like domain-containing protein n=1 Tax=marine sediment metagenome TaxID=412755 RepID=A0A0F9SWU4_9ZZZZ|nr:OmpA family protein [Halopseudomonas sabulinigri]HEC50586.1 OmpA family protein [Halopseudomonas sabulinigri]|tara:strand:+ start:6923 stop:7882 length:960 start_codon:yes stop_codon:yes gene_type:complete
MKLKNTVGLVVGSVIAASSIPAMAMSQQGSVEVEAFADRYFSDSKYDMNDGTLVGGSLGYFVTDDVLLNIGLGKYKGLETDATNTDIDGKLAQVEAVYHFGESNIRPYISAGLAHQELEQVGTSQDDRTTMAMAGVGIKNYLNENFFVKAGLDALYGFDHGNTEWQAGVGLGLNFGSKKEEAVVAAAAPVAMAQPEPAPEMQSVRVELDVLFDFDKDTIRPEYRQDIQSLAEFMRTYPSVTTTVEGHTDSVGSDTYNQNLSERRANAVREALIGEGVDGSRVSSAGYGEARPIADNSTDEGRSMNRRVEAEVEAEVEVR